MKGIIFVRMNIIKKIKAYINSLRYYVVLDPTDNSVTLSKKLFEHMKGNQNGYSDDKEGPPVIVFKLVKEKAYGFMLNPKIDRETQLSHVQYNSKYKCVGFETLCPSVGMILYDYHLPALVPVKLSVTPLKSAKDDMVYYKIDRPKGPDK